MTKFKIIYTGATSEEVEAETKEQAVEKFWDNDYRELSDIEIAMIEETDE